jgi:hypothetical protein
MISSLSLLGDEIVKITVGKGEAKKIFTVHKKKLCENVPYFDKMFNGPFKEGETQSATMPEDDSNTVSMMLGWVYTNKIDSFTMESTSGEQVVDTGCYIKLFRLAEKYTIAKLADETIAVLISGCAAANLIFQDDDYKLCYQLTHAESRLRLFASRMFAYTIDFYSDELCKFLVSKEIYELMVELPDLGEATIRLLRNQANKAVPDPRIAPACDYHQHAKSEKCPYAK